MQPSKRHTDPEELKSSKHSRFAKKFTSSRKVVPPQTPSNEDEVHDMVFNLKKHNKRYQNELDALELAYQEKCQEVFFLQQQLSLYKQRYGTLTEIEDMESALTEENMSDEEITDGMHEFKKELSEEEDDTESDDSKVNSLLSQKVSMAKSTNVCVPPHMRAETETESKHSSSPSIHSSMQSLPSYDHPGSPQMSQNYAYLPVETLTKSQVKTEKQKQHSKTFLLTFILLY